MAKGIERFFWKGIDSLAFYDQRVLANYIGVGFQLHTTIDDVAVRVPLTLRSLVDLLPAGSDRMNGREFFYLLFETGVEQDTLAEGVYVCEHRELGAFRLFLSPRRVDKFEAGEIEGEEEETEPVVVSTDTNLYRAIVYRIAYSAMGSEVAQNTDWPIHASRFNPESSMGFAPSVVGDYIVEGEGIEEA